MLNVLKLISFSFILITVLACTQPVDFQSKSLVHGRSTADVEPNEATDEPPTEGGVCQVICNSQFNQNDDGGLSGNDSTRDQIDQDTAVNESCGDVNEADGQSNDGEFKSVVQISSTGAAPNTACMSQSACGMIDEAIHEGSFKMKKARGKGFAPVSKTVFQSAESDKCETNISDSEVNELLK